MSQEEQENAPTMDIPNLVQNYSNDRQLIHVEFFDNGEETSVNCHLRNMNTDYILHALSTIIEDTMVKNVKDSVTEEEALDVIFNDIRENIKQLKARRAEKE